MNSTYKLSLDYSEWVVRHACGWAFSASVFPSLEKNESHWLILSPETYDKDIQDKLQRYANDYRLREIVEGETNWIRKEIISNALTNVYKGRN